MQEQYIDLVNRAVEKNILIIPAETSYDRLIIHSWLDNYVKRVNHAGFISNLVTKQEMEFAKCDNCSALIKFTESNPHSHGDDEYNMFELVCSRCDKSTWKEYWDEDELTYKCVKNCVMVSKQFNKISCGNSGLSICEDNDKALNMISEAIVVFGDLSDKLKDKNYHGIKLSEIISILSYESEPVKLLNFKSM